MTTAPTMAEAWDEFAKLVLDEKEEREGTRLTAEERSSVRNVFYSGAFAMMSLLMVELPKLPEAEAVAAIQHMRKELRVFMLGVVASARDEEQSGQFPPAGNSV